MHPLSLSADFCIDINSFFHLRIIIHISNLILEGENTKFSEDLNFSKIDSILTRVFSY